MLVVALGTIIKRGRVKLDYDNELNHNMYGLTVFMHSHTMIMRQHFSLKESQFAGNNA